MNTSTESIGIYPNPTNDFFKISASLNFKQNIEIILVNSMGQQILSFDIKNTDSFEQLINLKGFSKGLYYIIINTQFKVYRNKLILHW